MLAHVERSHRQRVGDARKVPRGGQQLLRGGTPRRPAAAVREHGNAQQLHREPTQRCCSAPGCAPRCAMPATAQDHALLQARRGACSVLRASPSDGQNTPRLRSERAELARVPAFLQALCASLLGRPTALGTSARLLARPSRLAHKPPCLGLAEAH